MEPVRLNKYLSDIGICSRREADRKMEEGRITVNGAKAEPGTKVTETDLVCIDGKAVTKKADPRVILAIHKPVGVVCTAKSFRGEKNIVDMVGYPTRLYPVGRLDKDSEGLIFLTNDGDFAKAVTDAAGKHEKEYEVTVRRDLTEPFIKRMERGIYLPELERQTAACKVTKTGDKSFKIVLTQGLNRQIRRMCENCGNEVVRLRRIRIMNVELADLKEGTWREIEGKEKAELLRAAGKPKGKQPAGKQTEKAAAGKTPEKKSFSKSK